MPKILINNVELYYQKHGDGEIPIVFIHGFLATSTMWQDYQYIFRLPRHYCAYTIDMRGHGQSHKVKKGCNLPQMADDIAKFIKKLNLGKCIYVGMSMGGATGLQLALDQTHLIKKLILISPGFGSPISGAGYLIAPLIPFVAQRQRFLRIMVKSALKKPSQEVLIQSLVNDGMLVSRETWREYLHPSNKIQGIENLGNLQVPTLIIIGAKDKTIPVEKQHQLGELIPQATKMVFKEEGHGLVNEKRDEVFKAIMSFIE